MRLIIVRTVLLATVLLGAPQMALAQDDRSCSNASLAGAWGYTETGTVMTPVGAIPAAALGRYDFDGAGSFTGTQYSSTAGNVAQDAKQGTYTVNSDCTASLMLRVYDQAGVLLRNSVWAVVVLDKGTELRGTMTSLVLGNGLSLSPIMSMTAIRMVPGQGDRACSLAAGTWGYSWTATFIRPTGPVPAAGVGTLRGDAAGELTGTQTTTLGGVSTEDTLIGSVIVNPDCTGSMTVHAYNEAGELLRTVDWALVYVDGVREARAMFRSLTLPDGARAPLVGTASAKRVFPGRSGGEFD